MPLLPRGDPSNPEDYSDELIGHNRTHMGSADHEITRPRKASIETEPTPESLSEKVSFSWGAFFGMVAAVSVALIALAFVPGVFDEIIVMVIVNIIYGFAQAHGFKLKKISKK